MGINVKLDLLKLHAALFEAPYPKGPPPKVAGAKLFYANVWGVNLPGGNPNPYPAFNCHFGLNTVVLTEVPKVSMSVVPPEGPTTIEPGPHSVGMQAPCSWVAIQTGKAPKGHVMITVDRLCTLMKDLLLEKLKVNNPLAETMSSPPLYIDPSYGPGYTTTTSGQMHFVHYNTYASSSDEATSTEWVENLKKSEKVMLVPEEVVSNVSPELPKLVDKKIPLIEATVLGQKVNGQSQSAVYKAIALGKSLKVAARAEPGKLHMRVEASDGMLNGKRSKLEALGFDYRGGYMSVHLALGTFPAAQAAIGLLAMMPDSFYSQVKNASEFNSTVGE